MDIPRKNEECIIAIEDLSREGEGIGRYGGYTLFVKDAVPGDRVRCVVTKAGKTFGYAHLLQVITPSPDRRKLPCPVGKTCGGCTLLSMNYEAQLSFKQKLVEETLRRVGGVSVNVSPVLGAPEEFRYRNKAAYPVAEKDGHLIAGFYAQHSHRIVEAEDCLLSPPEFSAILRYILSVCETAGISAYDEATGKGLLRHILLRKGFATGEIHVCLIGSGAPPKAEGAAEAGKNVRKKQKANGRRKGADAASLAEKIRREFPAVVGVSWNTNTSRGNAILGNDTAVLSGRGYLLDRIGGVTYAVSPESFYQVHPAQTKQLYDKVREFADLTGNEKVYDLYCGTGTIGLYLADRAERVTGIEIVPRAVEDAKANAARNGITNADFHTGKAEEVLPKLLADLEPDVEENSAPQAKTRPDTGETVIIVDPPRKGCERSLLETVLRTKARRMVYVSCDPATLARDLRILADGGFSISRIQPVDMFPQSCHVETIVLLQKLNS